MRPTSLRGDRNKIVISKIIIRKTTINKTVIDKVVIKIQETQEARRQGSKGMLRGKIIVEETMKLKQEDASHVEYAQKPNMEICLDARVSEVHSRPTRGISWHTQGGLPQMLRHSLQELHAS